MKFTVGYLLLILLFMWALAAPLCAEQVCSETIKASASEAMFTINAEGTITGNSTGLLWMRCSLGQNWDGKSCQGEAGLYLWAEALDVASGYDFAGYRDWRLPNKNELESLVEARCSTPAINEKVFPGTPANYFWTSSSYAGVAGGAWSVDFAYGTVNASVKTGKIHVRLVRDQSWD